MTGQGKWTRWVGYAVILLMSMTVYSNAEIQITLRPKDQKAEHYTVANFICQVSGEPTTIISWYKNGAPITSGRQRYLITEMPNGSVLRIEPVRDRRDEATFECAAVNGFGESATASARLEVYPEGQVPGGFPRITESPTLKAVEKGRNTVMLCRAEGNPSPRIHWLKDYIPVNMTDPKLLMLSSGSLQISDAQESHEGKYECVAENSVGVAYSYTANLYVRVRRVPPHFSVVPENVEVPVGASVNLTCVAVGSPMPYVRWKQGHEELTDEASVPLSKNTLTVPYVCKDTSYTCEAQSDLGLIEHDVEVKVTAPDPVPVIPTPKGLKATVKSSASVVLTWFDTSLDFEDNIFTVHITANGKDRYINTTLSSANIDFLRPNTEYEFSVKLIKRCFESPWSSSIKSITFEAVPNSAPSDLDIVPMNCMEEWLQLYWKPLCEPNGQITRYLVHYKTDVSEWTTESVPSKHVSTTIHGLIPDTPYYISVQAENSAGKGPRSTLLMYTTPADYGSSTEPTENPWSDG